jgi:signal transduction histidine kinase/iron only hydrogenase large subunit-like protein
VRECPAKAIRIEGGQAMVIKERCIACGNCVRVCSQNAKSVQDSYDDFERVFEDGNTVAAILAPSFPAAFSGISPKKVIGGIRELGFRYVCEVAFGADLVADRYLRLINQSKGKRYIATSCPAIIEFVEKYYPEYVDSLAPIVSPMVATARALKTIHGNSIKIVFIGPCIAKKLETDSDEIQGEVDLAITFSELDKLCKTRGIDVSTVEDGEVDAPLGGLGTLFPLARGLLQAAGIKEDLMTGEVIATDGRINFVEAIREFTEGAMDVKLLEVLCCNGCIMGPGMPSTEAGFQRRIAISNYTRNRMHQLDADTWTKTMTDLKELDLSRTFSPNDQRIKTPNTEELRTILERLGKLTEADELNCGACGYDTCREHAVAIYTGLAENEMCLPYTIDQLKKTLQELKESNEQLADVREALVQAEKLASMGQLAAGIAHEVNNPLGIVLMYAHFLLEELGQDSKRSEDLKMIVEQSNRCKKIVEGLLHFARQNKVILIPTDFTELVRKTVNLLRPPENIVVSVEADSSHQTADLDRDQMVQVITNLITNAYAAMPDGGKLAVQVGGDNENVWFSVRDTGVGITGENMSKIFEPFFTTKQMGKGTGLGLAVTYGIVKMHRGDIKVTSNADPGKGPTGTTFTVILPRHAPEDYRQENGFEIVTTETET